MKWLLASCLVLLPTLGWCGTQRELKDAGVYPQGGRLLLDRHVEITGSTQADGYVEVLGVSTPTTPSTGRTRVYFSSSTRNLRAIYDDGTTKSLDVTAQVTGVSQGIGIVVENVLGSITVDLSTPVALSSGTSTVWAGNQINYSSGTFNILAANQLQASSGSVRNFATVDIAISSVTYNRLMYVSSTSVLTNFPSTGVTGDLVSIVLPAGTWSISLLGYMTRNGSTPAGAMEFCIGTAAGNSTTGCTLGSSDIDDNMAATQNNLSLSIPNFLVNPSGSTTYYFKMQAGYTGGPPQLNGSLTAFRLF